MVYRPLLIPTWLRIPSWLRAGSDTSLGSTSVTDGASGFTPQDVMLVAGTGNLATDRTPLPEFAGGSDNDLSANQSASQDTGSQSPQDPTTLAGGGGVVDPGGPMQEFATSAPQADGAQSPQDSTTVAGGGGGGVVAPGAPMQEFASAGGPVTPQSPLAPITSRSADSITGGGVGGSVAPQSPQDPTTLAGGGGVVDPGGPMQEFAGGGGPVAPQSPQDAITSGSGDSIAGGGGGSLFAPENVSSGWLQEPTMGSLAGNNDTALLSQYMAASFPQAGTFSASAADSTALPTPAAMAPPATQLYDITQPALSQSMGEAVLHSAAQWG